MKHYFLRESSGPEVGSNFPQSISIQGNDPDCVNGVYQLMKSIDELPNFVPQIGDVVLESYAKLTDVISTAYFNQFLGKLLNKRALDIFLAHKLPSHQIYPVNVIYMEQCHSYYWLHIVSKEYKLINFEKSKYMKTSSIGSKTGDILIKSMADYLEEQKKGYQGYLINFERLYIYAHRVQFDLFSVKCGLSDIVINAQLKEALEENKITGLSFTELPKWVHFE